MEPNFLENALNEVRAEREYQNGKWGTVSDDTKNTPFHWLAWITKYASGFANGTWKPDTNVFRTSMVKVAAIAVAAVESIDRQRSRNGKAFFEE